MEWRLSGIRRWLPVLVLAFFVVESGLLLSLVVSDDQATIGDYVRLVLSALGVVVGSVMVIAAWRARVRVLDTGLEVRGGRRQRLVPYDQITRVYRDRFTAGGATLLLANGTKVSLPAPVAGLGVGSPEVDAAVDQIRARLVAHEDVGADPTA